MNLTLQDWHQRYLNQATWTSSIRFHLYQKANLGTAHRVLDAGCGTGALLPELLQYPSLQVYGVDLDLPSLSFAAAIAPQARLVQANILQIPFPENFFDISLFHFVLLWVPEPLRALIELKRVTRQGGAILALAEPDYGGRIDYPEVLHILGESQRTALKNQGADPWMGRKLRALFSQAGLRQVECGVLGGQWGTDFDEKAWIEEWEILENDLEYLQPKLGKKQVDDLRLSDYNAWRNGARILFVPTFYAFGRVS